jgi:hypothetical protein
MSTFGRKALIWWDYENRSKQNSIRFNHTPMDIQLSILEKWYPIGSNCNYIFYSQTNLSKINKYPSVILRYERCSSFYRIVISQNGVIDNKVGILERSVSPFKILISPDDIKRIKRESKLSRLGF